MHIRNSYKNNDRIYIGCAKIINAKTKSNNLHAISVRCTLSLCLFSVCIKINKISTHSFEEYVCAICIFKILRHMINICCEAYV